jgi:hypothetical protein
LSEEPVSGPKVEIDCIPELLGNAMMNDMMDYMSFGMMGGMGLVWVLLLIVLVLGIVALAKYLRT